MLRDTLAKMSTTQSINIYQTDPWLHWGISQTLGEDFFTTAGQEARHIPSMHWVPASPVGAAHVQTGCMSYFKPVFIQNKCFVHVCPSDTTTDFSSHSHFQPTIIFKQNEVHLMYLLAFFLKFSKRSHNPKILQQAPGTSKLFHICNFSYMYHLIF